MSSLDYSTEVITIDGEQKTLEEYRDKVLLIVNTATKCGLAPQFDGLESLWQEFGDQGLMILGFPCNQFARQEPGTTDEIATACRINFGVTFPLHQRIKVNGSQTHPLFKQLKKAAPGVFNTKAIKWNFTKFLVDPSGKIVDRFAPKTSPEELRTAIQNLLE